jgi:hypothetical protein
MQKVHCMEVGLARQTTEDACKGQLPFYAEVCVPTSLEAQHRRMQAACSRRASSLRLAPCASGLQLRQGGATTKPKYVCSKSAPVNSQGGSLCLLWGPHGHSTQMGGMLRPWMSSLAWVLRHYGARPDNLNTRPGAAVYLRHPYRCSCAIAETKRAHRRRREPDDMKR